MTMFDLIIRNVRIADGLGHPLIDGDLAVSDGRIAALGTVQGEGRESLDGQGMVLAPGVIDVHTHYDAQLIWDATASPSPALGVTTVVIGNCGFGIVPAAPENRDAILANLAEVEGMSLDSLKAGVKWKFETFGEYMELLRGQGVYPNVAALASHATIRQHVMGDAGAERAATADERQQMVQEFRAAMDAGAVGLGSSSNENHRGAGGVPIGSRLAEQVEFDDLAAVMADYNHGVFLITTGRHMEMDFMERMAELSGKPSLYAAHFHYPDEPERGERLMNEAQAARERGHAVYTQSSCQPLSLAFCLDDAYILKAIHPWPAATDHAELRQIFTDPGFRKEFREVLASPSAGRIFNGRWDWVIITRTGRPENIDLAGKSVGEVALARGVDPLDLFLDLALQEDFETFYTFYILNMEEDGVEQLLRNDGTLVSLSDAGAHNSLLCDAGYAMHFLGHWVRDRQAFDLPTAVRKLTSDPADVYGFIDRGRLTVGAYADMILFDPDSITITPMERHFDLPAEGERLLRRAPGLLGTWVNGVQVFDGEQYLTPARAPGQVLTRFSGTRPTLGMGSRISNAAD
ncbi:MAG: N-acyl-D-amino-acid deacylase [Gammaproteobacteria bacterium]|jgi:N-acyl-D-amino-acid deacylase